MADMVTIATGAALLHVGPSPRAEVNTQGRLGDMAEVLDRKAGWIRLRLSRSGDEGWAPSGAVSRGPWPPSRATVAVVRSLFANLYAAPSVRAPLILVAPLGARLVHAGNVRVDAGGAPWSRVRGPGGLRAFALTNDLSIRSAAWRWTTGAQLRAGLVHEALRLLDLPYRWGGTTPWGLDCSGLVQLVYGLHGIHLPHNARRQAGDPRMTPVSRTSIRSGDLLFFANFTHVGMAISNREFIHATTWGDPGVQITSLNHPLWVQRRHALLRIHPTSSSRHQRTFGAMKGLISIKENFNDPLPRSMLRAFVGRI